MRTARIILTSECERRCSYCCNDPRNNPAMHTVKRLRNLEGLNKYDEFVLTGGEPLGSQDMLTYTIAVAARLGTLYPGRPVYLYTATWDDNAGNAIIDRNLHRFKGITYTLHHPMQDRDYYSIFLMQASMMRHDPYRILNNRLIINSGIPVVKRPTIQVPVWREIREVDFVPDGNCTIGEDEDLFYYPAKGRR